MSFVSEFKEFAMKGSVVDLAVGVVIGGAFGKIVTSLVGDVIMPALSPILGSVNFSDLAVQIATNAAGKPVMLRYGAFIQTIFEFVIIALSIFIVIKGINKLKRPAPAAANAPPPPPTKTEVLLQEIRDLLARK
jgi:large conductance mechanosensitive channel